jgi:hypothetical protein
VADNGEPRELSGQPSADLRAGRAAHPWREGWRSLFLIGATVVLVLLGLEFKDAAAPGKENANLESGVPQLVGVYATDPTVAVHLTAVIYWRGPTGFPAHLPFEILFVTVAGSRPASLLITSGVPAFTLTFGRDIRHPHVTRDKTYQPAVLRRPLAPFPRESSGPMYVREMPPDLLRADTAPEQYGIPVGFFELGAITQKSRGSFFAHLPALGFNETTPRALPALMGEHSTSPGVRDFIDSPSLKDPKQFPEVGYGSPKTSSYRAFSSPQALYWQPTKLIMTEVLKDVQSEFENASVDSIVPANGSLLNNDYVWTAEGNLEPSMSLTNADAAASQSNWDFLSGIAFGVAAGAGIAFVQEEKNPVLSLVGRVFSSLWLVVRRIKRRTIG